MTERKESKFLKIVLIIMVALENLVLAASLLKNNSKGKVLSWSGTQDVCPLVCQELIDKKITLALKKNNQTQASVSKSITHLSLGSGGSNSSLSWQPITGSEFNLDLSDYSSKAQVYWIGNLKADDTHNRCYVRLFDTTNYRQVDYSLQSTNQTSYQNLTSQPVSIWRGNNSYRLEIKSLNGRPCDLTSPTLLIKY